MVTFQNSLDLEPPVNTIVVRKFLQDKMVMTLKCEDVISLAVFERIDAEKSNVSQALQYQKQ